jgi:hypothetical protein
MGGSRQRPPEGRALHSGSTAREARRVSQTEIF